MSINIITNINHGLFIILVWFGFVIIISAIISPFTNIYKTLLLKLINNDFLSNEKLTIIEYIYNKLNNLIDKSKIELINDIIEKFYYHIEDDTYFFDSSELLVKKIMKNQALLKNNYLDKFLSDDFNDKLKENHDKFINWFIN